MGDTYYFNTSLQILIHFEKFQEKILDIKRRTKYYKRIN